MSRRRQYKSEHQDRGDGACIHCFEDFPCAVARGEKYTSGIQEWADEHMKEAREKEAAVITEQNEKIMSVLEPLGISPRLSSYGGRVYIDLADLHKMALVLEAYAKKEETV